MIWNYIRKKLGLVELRSTLALFQDELKAQQTADTELVAKKLDLIQHSVVESITALKKDSCANRNTLNSLDEKFKNVCKEIVDNLKDADSNSATRSKELKQLAEELRQFRASERTIRETALQKLAEDQKERLKELVAEIKPILEARRKEVKKDEQKIIIYDNKVLDKNYFNALVGNAIPNCYNSSDIAEIPSSYTVFLNVELKRVGSGLQNRHCYDNALMFGKERQERICIGVIFPKSTLNQIMLDEEKKKKITITPYLHAWNLTAENQIADYTLGHKRAESYVYVGRILVSFSDLSAKGLEEILRKETIR